MPARCASRSAAPSVAWGTCSFVTTTWSSASSVRARLYLRRRRGPRPRIRRSGRHGAARAAARLAGTVDPRLALFQQIYLRVLKPAGWVKPRVVIDDPVPHRFAQGLGGSFLVAAVIALALSADIAGWALAALVVALAFVNFAFDFCVGCQLFFLLARSGVIRRA